MEGMYLLQLAAMTAWQEATTVALLSDEEVYVPNAVRAPSGTFKPLSRADFLDRKQRQRSQVPGCVFKAGIGDGFHPLAWPHVVRRNENFHGELQLAGGGTTRVLVRRKVSGVDYELVGEICELCTGTHAECRLIDHADGKMSAAGAHRTCHSGLVEQYAATVRSLGTQTPTVTAHCDLSSTLGWD